MNSRGNPGRLAQDLVDQVLAVRRSRSLGPAELALLSRALDARLGLGAEQVRVLVERAARGHADLALRPEELRVLASHLGEGAVRLAVEGTGARGGLADFVARHGLEEGLLLLDVLVGVVVADGLVKAAELGQLEEAARELGADPLFVSALLSKHDPRLGGTGRRVALSGHRVRIGRSPTNDLVLPDPSVAARHAELLRVGSGWRVVAGGRRPVVLEGRAVTSAPLPDGARLRLGPYELHLDGDAVLVSDERRFSALSVRGLSRRVGARVLLDGLRFTAFTGELVAVVGPSGSGKTSLLTALTGMVPADSGEVLLDGSPLHAILAADPNLAGEVPQDDIVLPELTVGESLEASARLRFAQDASDAEIAAAVGRVLTQLGLEDIAGQRVGSPERRGVSGGQRKRVNLGQELLTPSTRLLFLDEPLSGLDPAAAHDIVGLLRRLADQGRMVFLVTHDLSEPVMGQVDQLLVLARGGRLAWFGPPAEACVFFDVASPAAIMDRLEEGRPEDQAQRYLESAAARRYLLTREHLFQLRPSAPGGRLAARRPPRRSSWRTFLALSRRHGRVKARDATGLAVLVAQPVLLASVMAMAFGHVTTSLVFMLALSQLWFGMSAAVRELHHDRGVWRRERRVGVGVLPYLGSKVLVLAGITALQALALAGAVFWSTDMGRVGFSMPALGLTGVLTAWAGASLGLLVSAAWRSTEAAVGTLILLLVPQIVFSGVMLPLDEARAPARAMSWLAVQRYAFDASLKCGEEVEYRKLTGLDRGWTTRPVRGELYNLGLRPEDPVGDGIPYEVLAAVLIAIALLQLGAAGVLVALRDRPGAG